MYYTPSLSAAESGVDARRLMARAGTGTGPGHECGLLQSLQVRLSRSRFASSPPAGLPLEAPCGRASNLKHTSQFTRDQRWDEARTRLHFLSRGYRPIFSRHFLRFDVYVPPSSRGKEKSFKPIAKIAKSLVTCLHE